MRNSFPVSLVRTVTVCLFAVAMFFQPAHGQDGPDPLEVRRIEDLRRFLDRATKTVYGEGSPESKQWGKSQKGMDDMWRCATSLRVTLHGTGAAATQLSTTRPGDRPAPELNRTSGTVGQLENEVSRLMKVLFGPKWLDEYYPPKNDE